MTVFDSLPIDVDELRLRRIGTDDAADLLEIYSSPSVYEYELWGPWDADHVEATICFQAEVNVGDENQPLVLGVELQSERKLIGECQLTIADVDSRQGVIGYSFHPSYCGRGFATTAVNAALGFGFLGLNLHRIRAEVDVRNERSWRLLERLGMRREGHLLHANFRNGTWIDDYVYAMLKNEWAAR